MVYTPPRGRIFTYFKKFTITATSFASLPNDTITFQTQGVMILVESNAGAVQMSLTGTDSGVLAEYNALLPNRGIAYDDIIISQFWFKLASGSASPVVVSVSAWATQ